ncbi:uncharacterized protein LOC34621162 [Cyclospora cayetanensis]|uniref:holo-[acyl-carrier-protein] synthase n=1 Tax=Cyclospora cayetanensis TaxID=88456 RepID=A0A6P6S319_9EIME|nr:uncharacterized protein LOC34621162 [Cyclospora cayetanensis]
MLECPQPRQPPFLSAKAQAPAAARVLNDVKRRFSEEACRRGQGSTNFHPSDDPAFGCFRSEDSSFLREGSATFVHTRPACRGPPPAQAMQTATREPNHLAAAADVVVLDLGALTLGESEAELRLKALWPHVGAILPAQEILDSERYRRATDRLRAFSSRLLQRLLLSAYCCCDSKSLIIERKATRSKPIWRPSPSLESAFLHFNVSHDEGLVVFGASQHLVGVDCMRCACRGRDTEQFLRQMRGHCTPGDWAYVMEVSDPEQQLRRFMRVWTVKESFVKALGTGMYTDPQRLQCFFFPPCPPRISLDGTPQTDFYFRLEEEKAPGYVLCICVGPPSRALEEYKSCMPRCLEGAHTPITTAPPPEAWGFRSCSFPELLAAASAAATVRVVAFTAVSTALAHALLAAPVVTAIFIAGATAAA